MLNWTKQGITVFCETPAAVGIVRELGYRAGLIPDGKEPFDPSLRSEHYVVATNGSGKTVGQKLAASGLCKEWQISLLRAGSIEEIFLAHGGNAVEAEIASSVSIYHGEEHAFFDVVKEAASPTFTTAWSFMDKHIRWCFPEMVVVAGPYGSGKSAFAQMLACDFADHAGREMGATASICGWEDKDWRIKRNISRFGEFREEWHPKFRGDIEGRSDDLLRRVRHITRPPGEIRSIDWYLDRCEMQVKRYGTRFFSFDPWSQHDETRINQETETNYVNRVLKNIGQFVKVHNIIMIVVTHVSGKCYTDEGGIRPFRVASAHGSSFFGKTADRGFCIARTAKLVRGDRMIVRFDKIKDEGIGPGEMGDVADIAVEFDPKKMHMEYDPMATTMLREVWKR